MKCILHVINHRGMLPHTEVIVGAPNSDLFVGTGSMSLGKLLSQTVDVVEIAITLVLVLLL